MEKKAQTSETMKTHLCLPRLRATASPKSNHRLSPMTLLERFREAVFRLMMLSALSKATGNDYNKSNVIDGSSSVIISCYYPAHDPHHSEAVADCIEFIKKKAVVEEREEEEKDGGRNSIAGSSIGAATTEMVMPAACPTYVRN